MCVVNFIIFGQHIHAYEVRCRSRQRTNKNPSSHDKQHLILNGKSCLPEFVDCKCCEYLRVRLNKFPASKLYGLCLHKHFDVDSIRKRLLIRWRASGCAGECCDMMLDKQNVGLKLIFRILIGIVWQHGEGARSA